eukprot:TRINITY_DN579_c0_g1_i2.p1 TRINITY_DN579_c0_g1~~TRINITY_DN579_c0_g1_i2.p1  ORF type:complete len:266 (-),score=43.97 TRINITY_DN579_c0_g1_i2:216-965(-)
MSSTTKGVDGLQVIGAGFGRTGTKSTQDALDILGYKTHHMVEVIHHNQGQHWLEATRKKGKNVDWTPMLGGYTACVDWPSCAFYKELLAAFPHGKVVLTERDFDSWYKSVTESIYAGSKVFGADSLLALPLRIMLGTFRTQSKMADELIWEGTFHGRFEDKEYARKVYLAHVEEVKRVVPAGQLLVFNVRQGWEPLCKFLEKPIPSQPFPNTNDTKQFQARISRMKMVCAAMWALPVVIGAGVAYYLKK